VILPPNETVYKITGMPRWQRNWINNHRSINYSGLVQEMLCKIIKERDPEYYEKFKELLEQRNVKQKEVINQISTTINI
jgi:hypothetical protein